MSTVDENRKYPPAPEAGSPPRQVIENWQKSMGAETEQATAAVERHPREFILEEISHRCERLMDELAMLRDLRAKLQFMGRTEARLFLEIFRASQCTGLVRW